MDFLQGVFVLVEKSILSFSDGSDLKHTKHLTYRHELGS